MAFRAERISNKGGRESNEDACGFLMLEDGACWVVADGLGGHRGGEVAARLAVDTILDSFRRNRQMSPKALESHLLAAHNAIVESQKGGQQLQTMRTTVVVLLSDYESFLCGHVGDSRLYYLQGGRIDFQTKDHSVPQAMADAGDISEDEIRHHGDRNRLLRALGMEGELRPSIQMKSHPLYQEDAFLLCVDGFWEHVGEMEMEADLAKSSDPRDWLRIMESRVLARAKVGHDNYTAIAVFFQSSSAPEQPRRPWGRISPQLRFLRAEAGRSELFWRILPMASIGVAVLTLLALAIVVTRKYTHQRSIKVISRNPIKRMALPRGWAEVGIGDEAGPDPQQSGGYSPAGERDVSVHIDDQVGAPGSRNAEELRALLGGEEGSPDAQPESIASLAGANGCQDGPAGEFKAWTEVIKGKRVLIVESHCSRGQYDSYAVVVPANDDPTIWAREIVYSAPDSQYERYLKEFKQALQTIEWMESGQARARTRALRTLRL